MKALLADRGDLLVVTGLGSSSYDVFDAGEHPGNFYLWGAMGGAAMVGLGLALAQPKRPVAVITGDGEQLMGIGSLLTIARQEARQPLDRRARQRPFRRDRHADQPFRVSGHKLERDRDRQPACRSVTEITDIERHRRLPRASCKDLEGGPRLGAASVSPPAMSNARCRRATASI